MQSRRSVSHFACVISVFRCMHACLRLLMWSNINYHYLPSQRISASLTPKVLESVDCCDGGLMVWHRPVAQAAVGVARREAYVRRIGRPGLAFLELARATCSICCGISERDHVACSRYFLPLSLRVKVVEHVCLVLSVVLAIDYVFHIASVLQWYYAFTHGVSFRRTIAS